MDPHNRIKNKIVTAHNAAVILDEVRAKGQKIVFTNGCFDILHLGHIDYLSKAAALGDFLVIAVNSDSSVSKIKGKNRPINDERSRSMVLASLEFVSLIVLFAEDTPYELIKSLQPDVLVKGADYKPEDIVGYDVVSARGGSVQTIDYLPGYSTTAIEKRIVDAHSSQL